MNLRGVTVKYGRLVVFMRHVSAEIWKFEYGLALGIGKKINGEHRCFRAFSLCSQTLYSQCAESFKHDFYLDKV
jgi:hypothetical protein